MAEPFERPWSGATDANGSLTTTVTPFAAWASTFMVSGQIAAQGRQPIWTLFKNGSFLLPGSGPLVSLGKIRCQAADTLVIQVSGAPPNTTVSGSLWGYRSTNADGSDLPPESAISNSSSMPVTQNQVQLGSLVVPASTVAAQSWDVSPAYYAIAISLVGPSAVNILGVVGRTTGVTYYQINPSTFPKAGSLDPPSFYVVPINSAWDTRYRIDVTTNASGSAIAYVAAIQNPEAMFALAPTGNLQVTEEKATAAPWQAPNMVPIGLTFSLAANASQIIIPADPTMRIYLHSLDFFHTATTAGCFGKFTDTAGTADYGDWNAQVIGPFSFKYSGAALPINRGFVMANQSAVAMAGFVNGQLSASKGS